MASALLFCESDLFLLLPWKHTWTTMQVSSQLRVLVHIEWLSALHLWVQKVLWRSSAIGNSTHFDMGVSFHVSPNQHVRILNIRIRRKLNHHFLSDKRVLGIFPSIQVLKLLVVDFQKWCGYPQLFILLQVNIQGTHIYEDHKVIHLRSEVCVLIKGLTVCCLMLTPVCSSRPAGITAQTRYSHVTYCT